MGVDLLEVANQSFMARDALLLTCAKCTVQASFADASDRDIIRKAIDAGWRKNPLDGVSVICPKCVEGER